MQKIIIILILCFIFITYGVYAMTSNEYVAHLEKQLFGVIYENENLDKRIDRIEMQIYDNSYNGSNEDRLKKIYKIYPKENFEPLGQLPSNNYPQNTITDNNNYYDDEEKSNYNNYPIVSKIEESIYKRNYKGEDIYKRLSRIETELYGQEQNDKSLQDRVANLKTVLPKPKQTNYMAQSYSYTAIPFEYNSKPTNIYNITSAISELELQTFNRTFTNDTNENRLDRLESFYFGNNSNGKPQEERLAKLANAMVTHHNPNNYFKMPQNSQWAGLLINLLMIGLGFLL